ncbi:hypothetical protein DFH07DRAFT_960890 [Mycena maculata]|uniref:Uncharacterized protein n=1 Tax=Mycena maculata TaxID=230809 RepID=A0AAD7N9Y3_9AGAR|nr:hypothetical protein DFH07DRAFT_960890 [Mycena maculata]
MQSRDSGYEGSSGHEGSDDREGEGLDDDLAVVRGGHMTADAATEEATRHSNLFSSWFDEEPPIEWFNSPSPEHPEGTGGEEEENDELDVEQEGADGMQGTTSAAGPLQTRQSTQTVREDRSDCKVRDRTRKEHECKAWKEKKKEGGGWRFHALVEHVDYLEEEHVRIMCNTSAPGLQRMLRWMASDAGANQGDLTMVEEVELDQNMLSSDEEQLEPPTKRRRLMQQGSLEVEVKEPKESEDSEVEPEAPVAPQACSEPWPEDMQVMEGEEEVQILYEPATAPTVIVTVA